MLVRPAQLHGHGDFIIEVSQRAVRVERAGIQNSLGGLIYGGLLSAGERGSGEGVVDDILGITIIDLQPSTLSLHPRHMHMKCKDSKYLSSVQLYGK